MKCGVRKSVLIYDLLVAFVQMFPRLRDFYKGSWIPQEIPSEMTLGIPSKTPHGIPPEKPSEIIPVVFSRISSGIPLVVSPEVYSRNPVGVASMIYWESPSEILLGVPAEAPP